MKWLKRMFANEQQREPMADLYAALVREARDPAWYVEGGVPDTIDGRFDVLALVLSLAFIRIGGDDADKRLRTVELTERFVDDMDGQVRQIGFGEMVVGKHVGKMMGALGGRIAAYREGLDNNEDFQEALARNLYRGGDVSPDQLAWAAQRGHNFIVTLRGQPLDSLLAGHIGS